MMELDILRSATEFPKDFQEFMRDDSRINFIVYGTLIKKLFIENTDKKFLDIGRVAEMQEEDEEEL